MFNFNSRMHADLIMLSHKLKPNRWDFRTARQTLRRALPLMVAASLLMSLIGFVSPTTTLAQHQGEQTAEFLPSDTDLYLTVNLDPSGDQLLKFWTFVNNWWQDPNVQATWGNLTSTTENETGINIVEDIFPWLGPEIAMGIRNLATALEKEPEMIFFIGTMNKTTSDSFFFDKLMPAITEEGEEPPTGPSGTYSGIDTFYEPEESIYLAFPEEYIIFSNNQTFLEKSLDLIVTPNLTASLSGTTDFQAAQSALPAQRIAMFYLNYAHIWEQIVALVPPEQEPLIEAFGSYIPSCFAASIYFASHGIITTAYFPLPEGITLPSTEPDLLQSTRIVPGDAWLFSSAQNITADWETLRALIAEYWEDIVPSELLPPGIDTFDEMMAWLSTELGINIGTDVFGWMTGECAFVLLPVEDNPLAAGFVPDILVLFEVNNPTEVAGHLTEIIEFINTMIDQRTPIGETPDLLVTSNTTIDGVSATMISNNATAEAGASPGWLFLDVNTTHYLAIGTTTDALEAAVKASKGEIPSLDEADEYKGVLDLLPTTRISFGYINLGQIVNTIASQIPFGEISGEANVAEYIPLQWALGFSSALVDTNALTMTGALYLLPPPLTTQAIAQGTTGEVDIPEQVVDFSKIDASVGNCAVSISVDILDAPQGANIAITAVKELSAEVSSGFTLAATNSNLSIVNIAYAIVVDKTNLTGSNIGTANITMKVGKTWADSYGIDNIKIFRVSDGTTEALPTTFIGYEGDYAVFVGTSASGLSTFGLVAVAPSSTAFVMSDLVINPSEVTTGNSVIVTAKVTNNSMATGNHTVSLKLNDVVVDTKQVTLSGGASETVNFTITKDAAGTYNITVDGLSDSFTVTSEAGTNWALIGGIIGGVIVVAAAVAVILLRRRYAVA